MTNRILDNDELVEYLIGISDQAVLDAINDESASDLELSYKLAVTADVFGFANPCNDVVQSRNQELSHSRFRSWRSLRKYLEPAIAIVMIVGVMSIAYPFCLELSQDNPRNKPDTHTDVTPPALMENNPIRVEEKQIEEEKSKVKGAWKSQNSQFETIIVSFDSTSGQKILVNVDGIIYNLMTRSDDQKDQNQVQVHIFEGAKCNRKYLCDSGPHNSEESVSHFYSSNEINIVPFRKNTITPEQSYRPSQYCYGSAIEIPKTDESTELDLKGVYNVRSYFKFGKVLDPTNESPIDHK